MQTKTNKIQYSIDTEVVPLNGVEESKHSKTEKEQKQTNKQTPKKQKQTNTEEANKKQTGIKIKLELFQ